MLFKFTPGQGFALNDVGTSLTEVFIPSLSLRPINMFVGAYFICLGKTLPSERSNCIVFDQQASVCPRPEHCQELSWSVLHQFAGAVAGWHQAITGLSKSALQVNFTQQVEVDASAEVAQLWTAKSGQQVLTSPISPFVPWSPKDRLQTHGQVGDTSIMNVSQFQLNLLHTLSPPCQSWSRGGRRQGLSVANGFAFVEGLQLAFVCQPIILVAECADEVSTHPHYELLLNIAHRFGYRRVWSQVTPLHQLSPHVRRRWICVWIRSDVKACPFDATVSPSVFPRPSWDEAEYTFALPRSWQNQILLSESEKEYMATLSTCHLTSGSTFGTNPGFQDSFRQRAATHTLCGLH